MSSIETLGGRSPQELGNITNEEIPEYNQARFGSKELPQEDIEFVQEEKRGLEVFKKYDQALREFIRISDKTGEEISKAKIEELKILVLANYSVPKGYNRTADELKWIDGQLKEKFVLFEDSKTKEKKYFNTGSNAGLSEIQLVNRKTQEFRFWKKAELELDKILQGEEKSYPQKTIDKLIEEVAFLKGMFNESTPDQIKNKEEAKTYYMNKVLTKFDLIGGEYIRK